MIGILYFIIILFANSIGAISGMGGGVIIKPMFDLVNIHPVEAISFYSSVAVLVMSVVSTSKQIRSGMHIESGFATKISIGGIMGGYLGNLAFENILLLFPNGKEIQLIQISLTMITLIFSFLYSQNIWKNYSFESDYLEIIVGLLLGFLASLLGIGGGPINVALIMLLFNIEIKKGTVYSIIIIFFSQLSKLMTIILTGNINRYDLSLLFYIIPAAVLGGVIGSYISRRVSNKCVNQVYQFVIVIVLLINIYNGWKVI